MNDYKQTIVINADLSAVYAALTTPAGLRGWWTQDCDISTNVGDTITFRFGNTSKDMRIERLEPNREVGWLCTRAHIAASQLTRKNEWVGTRMIFRLTPDGAGRTRLDFEHIGLNPDLQCYDLCSNGWQYFMKSLQQLVETGRGTPAEFAAMCA